MELSLNTYSECVAAFREADQLMGSAFRQKLSALSGAREHYIARNQHKTNPEWGFVSKFATDCGVGHPYIVGISQIADKPKIVSALTKFSSVGYNTALALSKSDPDIIDTALEQLEQSGGDLSAIGIEPGDSDNAQSQRAKIEQKFGVEQPETVDGDFTEIDSPEPDLSNIKIDPASIAFGDTDLEQLATFVGLCGSTANLYSNQSGEQLTAEKFSGFVVNNFVQQLDSLDPSHRADHYSFLLNNLTELVGLLQQTIELIPRRIAQINFLISWEN